MVGCCRSVLSLALVCATCMSYVNVSLCYLMQAHSRVACWRYLRARLFGWSQETTTTCGHWHDLWKCVTIFGLKLTQLIHTNYYSTKSSEDYVNKYATVESVNLQLQEFSSLFAISFHATY